MTDSLLDEPVSMPEPPNHQGPRVWFSDAFCYTPWYSAALVTALRRAGADVRFIASRIEREPDYFTRQRIATDQGPFHFAHTVSKAPQAIRKSFRLLEAMANAAAMRRQLERGDGPDVIHLQQLPALNHGFRSDFRTIAVAQKCGIPVVHTVHNVLPHDSGSSLREIYQRLYSAVDHLICHSADVATRLTKEFAVNPQHISVVPHGPLFEAPSSTAREHAAARRLLGIEPERPVVLWQGVMAPYKGLDLLIQAWEMCMSRLQDMQPKPLLMIAGSGSPNEEVAAITAARQFPGSVRAEVRYITTAELPAFFHASDLLVYPYRAITTSGALLTGLSYQKPIIASDLTPFRQFLYQNENALLVQPGDVAALADALYASIRGISARPSQPSIYQTLLAGSARNRDRYTGWDTIAEQTLAVYQQLALRK